LRSRPVPPILETRRDHARIAQGVAVRNANGVTTAPASSTLRRDDSLAQLREVRASEYRPTLVLQSQQNTVQRDTRREGPGPVDRIDDPAEGRRSVETRAFLPEYAVVGEP